MPGRTLELDDTIGAGLEIGVLGQEIALDGGMAITSEYGRLIAFLSTDPEFAEYRDRLTAAGVIPHVVIEPNAIDGFPSNTTQSVMATYDDLTAEEKLGTIKVNSELPWLAIALRGDSEGIVNSGSASWTSGSRAASVAHEAAYQGVPVPTTLAEYKALLILHWRSCITLLKAAGASAVIMDTTTAQAFSNYLGPPTGGFWQAAPPSGANWWYAAAGGGADGTMRNRFDNAVTEGVIRDLCKACRGAIHNAAAYPFVPNSARAVTASPNWTSGFLYRKSGAGADLSPDMTVPDLRYWSKNTSARMWAEYRRATEQAYALGQIEEADLPLKVGGCLSGVGPGPEPQGFPLYQHWQGVGMQDSQAWAEDFGQAMFTGASADTPISGGPDIVIIWDNPRYFYITKATSPKASDDFVRLARWGHEVDFLGRAVVTGGEIFGPSHGDAAHLAWFDSNSLGDAVWSTPSAIWWTPGGGNQLGASVPFDPINGPLAPYLAKVSPTYASSNITQAIAIKAIAHAVSEAKVRGVELLRGLI
jgi:hypothetical protein